MEDFIKFVRIVSVILFSLILVIATYTLSMNIEQQQNKEYRLAEQLCVDLGFDIVTAFESDQQGEIIYLVCDKYPGTEIINWR